MKRRSLAAMAATLAMPIAVIAGVAANTGGPAANASSLTHTRVLAANDPQVSFGDSGGTQNWCRDIIIVDGVVVYDSGWYPC